MTVKVAGLQAYALVHPINTVKVASLQAYALISPPQPLSLRNLQAYAAVRIPDTLSLRNLQGYVAVSTASLPKGITGKDALLAMIVAKAKSTRPANHFTVVAPVDYTGDGGTHNTQVLTSPTQAALLSGSMYFIYNRVDIKRMMDDPSSLAFGSATTVHELIPAINAATGMIITTDDLVNKPLVPGAGVVTVTAASTSYFFTPGTTIVLGQAKTLTSQITKKRLSGFTPATD